MGRKIIKQNSSFGVLRANPRISGNVKITVDSNGDIWLNSIDSNPEMSNERYKGFKINEGSSYDKDLYYFFDEGKTPPQFVFGIFGEDELAPINQLKDISKTYDFRYSVGVTPLISSKYKEEFSYFAPLYLGEDIPDYFVIFRVKDPIDYPYQIPATNLTIGKNYKVVEDPNVDKNDPNYTPYKIKCGNKIYGNGDIFTANSNNFTALQGQGNVILLDPLYNLPKIEDIDSHFREKILPKATIVATFDLTENSKIGKYLRNIKNNPGYTPNLIDIRFEENQISTYNGVNYRIGIFDKKGEYLFDYFSKPTSQIEFEDYITDGFRRNGIISYSLLNLEFLFNDEDSKNYTINRYFGLYVNAIEMATFRLDGNALYKDNGASGNTPIPERNNKGYYYQETPYYQYNKNGVRLFIDPDSISGVIPNSDDVNLKESTKLFWIKDKNGKFHSLKRDINYSSSPTPYSIYGLPGTENQIVIQDTSIDLSVLTGFDPKTKKQYTGYSTGEKGRAYSVIRFGGQLTDYNEDCFIFYHPFGYHGAPGEKYDIIRTSDLSSMIDGWGPGSFYARDNVYYIHPFGAPEDLAKALTGVFNSFNYNSFEAFQYGAEVVIRVKATGAKENTRFALDFYENFHSSPPSRMPDSRRGTIFINEKDVCDINRKQFFIGGSDYSSTRIKVKIEDANKIQIGETFLETIKNIKTNRSNDPPGYSDKSASVVIGKYRFVDQYDKDKNQKIIGLKDFNTHMTIEVANPSEKISIGSINKISAFNIYNIPLGIFSFYGLRELDTDFWHSEYGYTPTQEYYKHLDIQPDGKTKILPSKTYYVSDGAEIMYNGANITGPDVFKGITGETRYKLLKPSQSAPSNVYPTLSICGISNNSSPLNPHDLDARFYPDLDTFPGFYGIQALSFIDSNPASHSKEEQLMSGKLKSEYDYTQDNYNKKFAIKSRIIPYITKWVYNGGTDVRGNDYRLNSNIAFSPLNFSPSFFRRKQDPQYFTHEWYQLMNPPSNLPEENLFFDKNYLSITKDGEYISLSELISDLSDANPAGEDYFLKYFTVEGEDLRAHYPDSQTIENVNFTERFSIFKFNEGSSYPETLFRGVKIRIKKTYTDYTHGKKIKYIKDNKFYDNYKFSCLIVPVEDNRKIQSPFKIRVLENRTFKTIVFILEVLIDDARAQKISGPSGSYIDLDYFLLYSLKDRISSEQININPYFSPSPLQIEIPTIGDAKLSAALNITSYPNEAGLISSVDNSGGRIYIIPNPEYETDLRDEIGLVYLPTIQLAGETGTGVYTGPGSFYGYVAPTAGGNPPNYIFPYPVGVGENFVSFKGINYSTKYKFDFTLIGLPPNPGPLYVPTTMDIDTIKDIPIYQKKGGIDYWKKILEKISFANISLMVNTNNPYIEYISYVWDEKTKTTKSLLNDFSLEFLKPSAYTQEEILIPEEDTDKPAELSTFFIGYRLNKINKKTELYRYSGGYVPKFREILKFEKVKKDEPKWMMPSLVTHINNKAYPTYRVTIGPKPENSKRYDLGSNFCIYIDGIPQKEITLIRGKTYAFDQSDPSNYNEKLYFSEKEIGNSFPADALMDNYSYYGTPGMPNLPFVGALITVPYNWPDTVYYVSAGGKYMGQKIRIIDSIEYCYCSFGPSKYGFGKIKNINYHKYSNEWIFKIGKNSPYNPLYNLIGETPIDKRDLSLFESSWDPGFYREYLTSTKYIDLPGTKNMKEDKSFFGSKAMKTPNIIISQKQIVYPTSIDDVFNINYDNYPNYEIFWEDTPKELRGVLLIDRIIARYFLENGGKKVFETFIVPEFSYGNSNTIDDDFNQYIKENIIPIFQCKNNRAYIKKIPIENGKDLNPVIGDLLDHQKLMNGYYHSKDIKFTKVNELRYEFTITKNPSFDYSVGFSIEISKI